MAELTQNAERVLQARYLARDEAGRILEDFDGLCRRVARTVAAAEDEYVSPAEADAIEAPLRKGDKLPETTIGEDYALEYGTDRIEMHIDAVGSGDRLLLIDDLLATGGTALAAIRPIEQAGGQIAGCAFIVDLPDIGGGRKIQAAGHDYMALVEFEGD